MEKFNTSKRLNRQIIRTLFLHEKEDHKKGRDFNLTVDYVKDMLKRKLDYGFTCTCCSKIMDILGGVNNDDAWSIDRLNNVVGHIIGNCRIICRHCNCSQK